MSDSSPPEPKKIYPTLHSKKSDLFEQDQPKPNPLTHSKVSPSEVSPERQRSSSDVGTTSQGIVGVPNETCMSNDDLMKFDEDNISDPHDILINARTKLKPVQREEIKMDFMTTNMTYGNYHSTQNSRSLSPKTPNSAPTSSFSMEVGEDQRLPNSNKINQSSRSSSNAHIANLFPKSQGATSASPNQSTLPNPTVYDNSSQPGNHPLLDPQIGYKLNMKEYNEPTERKSSGMTPGTPQKDPYAPSAPSGGAYGISSQYQTTQQSQTSSNNTRWGNSQYEELNWQSGSNYAKRKEYLSTDQKTEVANISSDLKRNIEKDSHRFTPLFYYKRIPLSHPPQVPIPNWFAIESSLAKLVTTSGGGKSGESLLKEIIRSYNTFSSCNFGVVHDKEIASLFAKHLPKIARHALKLSERLGMQIAPLKSGENRTFYLTRNLACSLIAHAVLCTISNSNSIDGLNDDFNFFNLYDETPEFEKTNVKKEKLKCFLEYFAQMERMPPSEGHSIISFERRCIKTRKDWTNAKNQLCQVIIDHRGKIEDATGMLQVDFANRRIGGGVLGSGAVQEEIRFCINPELLCSMLFVEQLGHDEVLVITGTKIFSSYSGYGNSFKFIKLRDDPWAINEGKDNLGRGFSQIVAMDAWNYKPHDKMMQYEVDKIDRDLHKSFVAFLQGQHKTPVATGNWGCGYFNGDPQLKFLIQWMAASVNDRPQLKFFAEDDFSARKLIEVKELLRSNNVTVGQLYQIICRYEQKNITVMSFSSPPSLTVFEFLEKEIRKPKASRWFSSGRR